MTTTQTTTSKYAVCVEHINNARALFDDCRGYYTRYFETKRDAWNYVQTVGRHADAKPYMEVWVTVVELESGRYAHVYGTIFNAR